MIVPILSNLENTGKDYINRSLTCWNTVLKRHFM
nr:MAG TPA: hypothetical protein [Caudoviricetes sp.]